MLNKKVIILTVLLILVAGLLPARALEVKGGMNLHISRKNTEPGYYGRIGEVIGLRTDYRESESSLYYYDDEGVYNDKQYLNKKVKNLLLSLQLDSKKFYFSLAGGPYFIKFEDPRTGETDQVNPFGLKGECGYKINLKDNLDLSFSVGLDLVGNVPGNDIDIADHVQGDDSSGGFYYGTGISILF